MDRAKAKAIHARMAELLKPIETELGVMITMKSGSFGMSEFSCGATFRDEGMPSKMEQDYASAKIIHKLRDFGSTIPVYIKGHEELCTIIGWDTKKRKYPIIVTAPNGDRYKLPKSMAQIDAYK